MAIWVVKMGGGGSITQAPRDLQGDPGAPSRKILKSRVPEMPFSIFWGRFYRILKIIKRRIDPQYVIYPMAVQRKTAD